MENKILVNVIVPVLEENFNVFIPAGKTVESVTKLLRECISELSTVSFSDKELKLYDSEGRRLGSDRYIKDSGISNGSKIILI